MTLVSSEILNGYKKCIEKKYATTLKLQLVSLNLYEMMYYIILQIKRTNEV